MKKIFILGLFLVLCVSSAVFAKGDPNDKRSEINLNYTIGEQDFIIRGDDTNWTFHYPVVPLGIELNTVKWKSGRTGLYEYGFDFDMDIAFFGTPYVDGWEQDDMTSFHQSFSFGPTFAFNVHKRHQLRITPALQFNFDEATYTGSDDDFSNTFVSFYTAFSINLGYHIFITKNFAINTGFDMDIPLIGIQANFYEREYYEDSYYGYSEKYTDDGADFNMISGGYDFRWYVGVTWRKGRRGYIGKNRWANEAATVTNASATNTPPVPGSATSAPPVPNQTYKYNVVINGASSGPYDVETLRQMAKGGAITKDSLVWREGMSDWAKASSVAELRTIF